MRNCDHPNKKIEQMPQGHVHHAREICADCATHIRWLPKPETIEREAENQRRVAEIRKRKLNSWTMGFVESISQLRKLSPRQQETLDKIYEEEK